MLVKKKRLQCVFSLAIFHLSNPLAASTDIP